ncbi:MAG: hypothetical protein QXH51_07670 [Candidatus Bathyarchaeia archaeon]
MVERVHKTIAISRKVYEEAKKLLKDPRYRSFSHLVEIALWKIIDEEKSRRGQPP